jgi:hypothetical protein
MMPSLKRRNSLKKNNTSKNWSKRRNGMNKTVVPAMPPSTPKSRSPRLSTPDEADFRALMQGH